MKGHQRVHSNHPGVLKSIRIFGQVVRKHYWSMFPTCRAGIRDRNNTEAIFEKFVHIGDLR